MILFYIDHKNNNNNNAEIFEYYFIEYTCISIIAVLSNMNLRFLHVTHVCTCDILIIFFNAVIQIQVQVCDK